MRRIFSHIFLVCPQEAEDESESSFDDNCSRSISSTEFILDSSHLATESQHHHDFEELYVAAQPSSSIVAVPFPSYPHPNVNAPEFVPTNIELSLSLTDASDLPDHNNRSPESVDSCHDELPSKKTSVLNVHCGESYQDRPKKRDDSESVSCSNNSDSGISSPGSEDISKNGFSQKESKNHQSDETKNKKPRSRKSAANKTTKTKQTGSEDVRKSSSQHVKTITCIVPTYRESREVKASTNDEQKRDAKKSVVNGKSVPKKAAATRNKEKKNETVIVSKADKKSSSDKRKNTKKATVLSDSVVQPTLDVAGTVDEKVDDTLPLEIHSHVENSSSVVLLDERVNDDPNRKLSPVHNLSLIHI